MKLVELPVQPTPTKQHGNSVKEGWHGQYSQVKMNFVRPPPFPTKQSVDRRTKVEMVSYGREFYIVVALVPTKQIKQCVDSVKTLVMARYVEWNRTFYCPLFSETIRWYLIAERRLTWFVHSSANNSCKATVYPKNPYVDSVFRPATPTKYYVDNLKKVTLQNNTLIMVKKSWHGNLC